MTRDPAKLREEAAAYRESKRKRALAEMDRHVTIDDLLYMPSASADALSAFNHILEERTPPFSTARTAIEDGQGRWAVGLIKHRGEP